MNPTVRRTTRAAATLLLLALAAGACSGDEDPAESGAGPTPASPSAPEAVRTVVTFGQVTGKLPREARTRLARQVGGVVDGWTDAAYLSGDYPRRDFDDSWPGFTPGAREQAHHDQALMSNKDIGAKVDGAAAKRSRVRLDVLAVKQRPVGVTAHVGFRFKTTGRAEHDVRVEGRLYLTHTKRGWRVFGYDMTKGEAR
jgi:hypothetical protein